MIFKDTASAAKIIGKALFLASITSAIASVEMSSKFSVINFSKDQKTLQRAADALRGYIYVGVIWAVASMLTLYSSYGWVGALAGFLANLLMMLWIVLSYIHSFEQAAKENGLQKPIVFTPTGWWIVSILTALSGILCLFFLLKGCGDKKKRSS